MRQLSRALPVLALLLAAPLAAQQLVEDVASGEAIGEHIRILASDSFLGRAPGGKGEEYTTAYIARVLQQAGVKPGNGSSYLQPIKLNVHDQARGTPVELIISGRVNDTLELGRDMRPWNASARRKVATGGELVYVGYGISAPVYHWDDLEGVDLAGKIAIAEVGEPTVADDTTLFNGVRASRYGYASAKIRELERCGAIGVLWIVKSGNMSKAPPRGIRQRASLGDRPLKMGGNIADSTVARLLPPGSPPLADLRAAAARPGFKALPLGVRLDVRFETRPTLMLSSNVIGIVPGTDPALRNEYVVLSAHWDAYGVGPAVNGDSIYNGALDDASGSAVLLELARVIAKNPPRRSIAFLFTTAEEWGMVGSEAFVAEGPIPMDRVIANLNMDDGVELFGRKSDAATLGVELSSLGNTVAEVAGRMGLTLSPDPLPEEGLFLRSDQLPFALAGVPSLYMALGTKAVGRPERFVLDKIQEYLDKHYHRPSDEYDAVVVDLGGAAQYATFVYEVAMSVANTTARPTWNVGAEFGTDARTP